ncbi:MAG: hypothetical protein ACXWPK_06760 [Isosphaeraceae bacterium]
MLQQKDRDCEGFHKVDPKKTQRSAGHCEQDHISMLPGKFLTVTDFGGLDVGIPQAMRRSIDFAANSHGIGAG